MSIFESLKASLKEAVEIEQGRKEVSRKTSYSQKEVDVICSQK